MIQLEERAKGNVTFNLNKCNNGIILTMRLKKEFREKRLENVITFKHEYHGGTINNKCYYHKKRLT